MMVVVISHCANAGFLPDILGHGFGQQGVTLFYVLSGYLIAYLYLDRDFDSRSLSAYAVARGARVLPLFYAVVLVATLIWVLTGTDFYDFETLTGLAGNLALVQGARVLWSIPVEVQFYVLFVGLWWATTRFGVPRWAGLAGLFGVQVALWALTDTGTASLPYWLHFFIVGGIAASVRAPARLPSWIGVAVLCALPLALPEVRRILGWVVLPNYLDPITAGYPILVFLLVLWGAKAFSFLANPVLRYMGQISFGAYLIHWPMLDIVASLGVEGILGFLLVTAATLLLASASLYLYERPVQRTLRSSGRLVPSSAR